MKTPHDEGTRVRVRTRRLQAELATVLRVPIAAIHDAPAETRAGPTSRLMAALLLLGAVIPVAVTWQLPRREAPLQQPTMLEPPAVPGPILSAQRDGEVAAWPEDLQAARLWLLGASTMQNDLSALARLRALRCLAITGEAAWGVPSMSVLAALPKLEVLELPVNQAITAEHLRAMAKAPSLRFVTLHLRRSLTDEDVDALAAWPQLLSLGIEGGSIEATTVHRMARLPVLQELTLDDLDHGGEEALQELQSLTTLRALHLARMGHVPRPLQGPSLDGEKRSAGLTTNVAAALANLPHLRELTFDQVEIDAAALDLLPTTLEHLGITGAPQADADLFARLGRLRHLQQLDLDAGDRQALWGTLHFTDAEAAVRDMFRDSPPRAAVWQAQADLLRRLAPSTLRWTGALPDAVRAVLPSLPLAALELRRPTAHDLAGIAVLTTLQQVTLEDCALDDEGIDALAALPHLTTLMLRFASVTRPERLPARLPHVRVTQHGL